MELILPWTIWATAFASSPDMAALDRLCRQSQVGARMTVSRETVVWRGKYYETAMLICARPGERGDAEPQPEGGDDKPPEPKQQAL